jgi:DNA-binding CsgD family transcriptional regulator
VSQILGISVHTVRRHVANLSAKLGLHGTTALTLYAIQNGFVRDR